MRNRTPNQVSSSIRPTLGKIIIFYWRGYQLSKSHWYLMAWLWKQGILRLATTQQAPGTLAVTAGREVTKELVPEYLPPRPSKHWECIFHHQDLNSSKQTC